MVRSVKAKGRNFRNGECSNLRKERHSWLSAAALEALHAKVNPKHQEWLGAGKSPSTFLPQSLQLLLVFYCDDVNFNVVVVLHVHTHTHEKVFMHT